MTENWGAYQAILIGSKYALTLRNPQPVVDCRGQLLLHTQIAFGGLDGGVAEQQLDLLEGAARLAAEQF